jgi:predicted site-specific integrase-resolvase
MKNTCYCKLTTYAKRHGVTRSTALQWAIEGRLKTAIRMVEGTIILDISEPKPEARRPWAKDRDIRNMLDT